MSPHSRRQVALPVMVARYKKTAGSFQLDGRINEPEPERPDLFRTRNPELTVHDDCALDFHSDEEDSFTGEAAILSKIGVCTARYIRVEVKKTAASRDSLLFRS